LEFYNDNITIETNREGIIEAAEELGLLEKVKKVGWSKLSAQETGKIGSIVKKKMKLQQEVGKKEKL